jgi:hypothetical protein
MFCVPSFVVVWWASSNNASLVYDNLLYLIAFSKCFVCSSLHWGMPFTCELVLNIFTFPTIFEGVLHLQEVSNSLLKVWPNLLNDNDFCIMVWSSPCPLCWVRHHANLLGQAGWCTEHNGQGWDHSLTWRSAVADSTIQKETTFNKKFGHYYEFMIITRRLCHIMWSRKSHSMPFQT